MPYIKTRILIKWPTLSSERQKLRHIFRKSLLKVLFDNLPSDICLPLSPTRILERLDRSGSSEWNCMSFSSPPDARHHIPPRASTRPQSSCSSADRSSSARNCCFDISASCHHQEPPTSSQGRVDCRDRSLVSRKRRSAA